MHNEILLFPSSTIRTARNDTSTLPRQLDSDPLSCQLSSRCQLIVFRIRLTTIFITFLPYPYGSDGIYGKFMYSWNIFAPYGVRNGYANSYRYTVLVEEHASFSEKNVSNSEFPACKCTYFLAELPPPVILIFRSGKNLQIFFLRESQSLISSRFTIQFLPALPNVNSKLELGSLQKVYGYKIAGIFRNLLEKRQTFSNSRDSFKFFIRDGRVTCCFNDSCIAKQLRLSVSFIV